MIRTQQLTRKALLPSICCLLAWNTLLAQDAPTRLNLVVLRGEGAANRAGGRSAQGPSVRVEDENNRPVSKAAVVFTLPTSGPTGDFDGGGKTVTVFSDDKGVAAVRGVRVNEIPGQMQILVNVAYRGQTTSTVITEFIVAPNGVSSGSGSGSGKSKGKGKMIAILAVVVAGGGVGAFAALHKSGSSSPSGTGTGGGTGGGTPATIVLTLGSSAVGAPHP